MTLTHHRQGVSDSPVSDIEVLFKEAKVRQRRRRLGWLIVVICVAAAATLCDHEAYREPSFYAEEHGKAPFEPHFPQGRPTKSLRGPPTHHVVVISTRSGAILSHVGF